MISFASPPIEALRRKLKRSLAQRGVLRTAQRCITKPLQALWNVIRYALPHERRFRTEELAFDKRCNIDTQVDRDSNWMAAIASPNWMHGIGYAPIPFADLRDILAGLDLPYERFTFVDLGAGKGRALFVAAEFPFERIVGVEYSPRLAEALQRNIASYRNLRQRCGELQGLLEDATRYALPHDPLVLFFHHPFEAVIFRQVVQRIEASLGEHPRHIVAIYYDPKCRMVFDQSSHFRRLQEGRSHLLASAAGDWVVYEAVLMANAGEP